MDIKRKTSNISQLLADPLRYEKLNEIVLPASKPDASASGEAIAAMPEAERRTTKDIIRGLLQNRVG